MLQGTLAVIDRLSCVILNTASQWYVLLGCSVYSASPFWATVQWQLLELILTQCRIIRPYLYDVMLHGPDWLWFSAENDNYIISQSCLVTFSLLKCCQLCLAQRYCKKGTQNRAEIKSCAWKPLVTRLGEVNQLWNMYQLWNKECRSNQFHPKVSLDLNVL